MLPQTVSLLRNTRVVFTTLADVTPGLRRTSVNLQHILGGVNAMEGGFRALVDRGSGQLAAVDNLIADNPNMVQLLGNLTHVLAAAVYVFGAAEYVGAPPRVPIEPPIDDFPRRRCLGDRGVLPQLPLRLQPSAPAILAGGFPRAVPLHLLR